MIIHDTVFFSRGSRFILDIPFTTEIILIIFLLLFSGFFSGSETALFSLSLVQRERLKKGSTKKAKLIKKLLSQPKRLIVTILIGNDMVNITASVIAAYLFVSIFGKEYGRWVTIGVMTPLTLIFAEIIPKTLFIVHNEKIAPSVSLPITSFSKLITPLRFLFEKTADIIIKILGFEKQQINPPIMENDFLEMVDLSHEDGELNVSERDLIHNVFEFSDTKVFEVMTPIDKMFSIPHNMKSGDIVRDVKGSLHSRVPVYKNKHSNIVGILYAKDLLKVNLEKVKDQTNLLPKLWRKAYFIGEGQKIDKLFYLLKKKRTHMAICLDKTGKVSGLITMEDILEELFGEIYDEHEPDEHKPDEHKPNEPKPEEI